MGMTDYKTCTVGVTLLAQYEPKPKPSVKCHYLAGCNGRGWIAGELMETLRPRLCKPGDMPHMYSMQHIPASTLYLSWAEMGTTGASLAIVPSMNDWMASCWLVAALSLIKSILFCAHTHTTRLLSSTVGLLCYGAQMHCCCNNDLE